MKEEEKRHLAAMEIDSEMISLMLGNDVQR